MKYPSWTNLPVSIVLILTLVIMSLGWVIFGIWGGIIGAFSFYFYGTAADKKKMEIDTMLSKKRDHNKKVLQY